MLELLRQGRLGSCRLQILAISGRTCDSYWLPITKTMALRAAPKRSTPGEDQFFATAVRRIQSRLTGIFRCSHLTSPTFFEKRPDMSTGDSNQVGVVSYVGRFCKHPLHTGSATDTRTRATNEIKPSFAQRTRRNETFAISRNNS